MPQAKFITLGRRMLGLREETEPRAYSRITRTPIYHGDSSSIFGSLPRGSLGGYFPKDDEIQLTPESLQNIDKSVIPHESAHAIFHHAGLESSARKLAPEIPFRSRAILDSLSQAYDTSSPEVLANEGLGYGMGHPDASPYVDRVAGYIKDPRIAAQLRRLQANAVGSNLRGIGGTN